MAGDEQAALQLPWPSHTGRSIGAYLLRDGNTDLFKVGISMSPAHRLREVRKNLERPGLQIVRVVFLPSTAAYEVEREILDAVGLRAGDGELFAATPAKAFELYDRAVAARHPQGAAFTRLESMPMADGDDPEDSAVGEWLTVSAAARRLGITPRAIRGRIARQSIKWRPQGNVGKTVFVPFAEVREDDPGEVESDPQDELEDLRAELTAALIAQARAEERAAALRELADRLTAELAELRRPWWRRWIG